MLDHTHPFYNQYQANTSSWGTDFWLRQIGWMKKLGVRSQDLDCHAQADAVVYLLNMRMEHWERMNRSEQAVWGAYWGLIYRNHKPLKPKSITKLESIKTTVHNRQLKIKQLRQIATQHDQNKDHDMMAKGSNLSHSKLVKENQQGGRKEQETPPWE